MSAKSIDATYRNGRIELSGPVDWPDGTPLEVTPRVTTAQADSANASYADFISRLAGSFGDQPFERPDQGEFEQREEW